MNAPNSWMLTCALACLSMQGAWAQNCNDLAHPERSPSSGVEVFFLKEGEFPREGAPEIKWPFAGLGDSSVVVPAHGSLHTDHNDHQTGGSSHNEPPYQSPFVVANHVDPAKQDAKGMSGDYYWVVFYEPDGKGSRRLCRWEYWINRLPYRNAKVTPPSVPAQYELNPVLKPWTRDYLRSVIRQYVYAADGRLAWTGSSDYSTDKWVHYPLQCYFYDQQGRPSRTVKVNPQLDALRQITSSCQARTSGEATLLDYFYDSRTGAYRGMRNQASAVLHGTDDEESRKAFREKPAVPNQVTWDYRPDGKDYIVKGEWQPRSNNNFTDEVKFETTFEAETVPGRKNRWRPHDEQTYFRYYLYDPALVLSVQAKDDPIAELKRLHRLRVQNWGAGPVYEHFTPQGILRHRLFTLGGGRTVRHEQFDEQGRLKRIINLGLMENKDKDSYYPENLAAHKDQIKVGQYLMFRVYEYDGTGKEQLVALSWYPRSPYDHLPNNVVDSAVKDAKRAWQNYRRPEKAAENNTFPPQFFGTPDGAVKWNDRDSFMKSFGFYETLNELKQWGEEQIKASK